MSQPLVQKLESLSVAVEYVASLLPLTCKLHGMGVYLSSSSEHFNHSVTSTVTSR